MQQYQQQQRNHFIPTLNNICQLEKCGNPIISNHDVVRFKCGHSFHMECIMDVLRDKSGPYCDVCDFLEQNQNPDARKRRIERSEQFQFEKQKTPKQIHSLQQAIDKYKITTLEGLISAGLKAEHLIDKHSYPLELLFKTVQCTPEELHTSLSIPNLEFMTQNYTASELSNVGYNGKTLISLGLTFENVEKHFSSGPEDLQEFYFTQEELNKIGYQLVVDRELLSRQNQEQELKQEFIGNAQEAVLQAKKEMLTVHQKQRFKK